ncbi:MAG: hypothetical protein IJ837_00090 [Clostridia bacterium]|nr:hypothetical protein [Clostridia bacterium]
MAGNEEKKIKEFEITRYENNQKIIFKDMRIYNAYLLINDWDKFVKIFGEGKTSENGIVYDFGPIPSNKKERKEWEKNYNATMKKYKDEFVKPATAILKKERRFNFGMGAMSALGIAGIVAGSILTGGALTIPLLAVGAGLTAGGATGLGLNWKAILGRDPEVRRARDIRYFTNKEKEERRCIEKINKRLAEKGWTLGSKECENDNQIQTQLEKLGKIQSKELEHIEKVTGKLKKEYERQQGHAGDITRNGVRGKLDKVRQAFARFADNWLENDKWINAGQARIDAARENIAVLQGDYEQILRRRESLGLEEDVDDKIKKYKEANESFDADKQETEMKAFNEEQEQQKAVEKAKQEQAEIKKLAKAKENFEMFSDIYSVDIDIDINKVNNYEGLIRKIPKEYRNAFKDFNETAGKLNKNELEKFKESEKLRKRSSDIKAELDGATDEAEKNKIYEREYRNLLGKYYIKNNNIKNETELENHKAAFDKLCKEHKTEAKKIVNAAIKHGLNGDEKKMMDAVRDNVSLAFGGK